MNDKLKYIFNQIIFLIKSVLYITITGLIAVLFGEFLVWLSNIFYKIFK